MATRIIRIVNEYAMVNIKERIEIILNNYPNSLGIMDGFEESLKYLIISGGKMVKCRSREDPGARVQMSGLSGPTASTAADSVVLTEAVRSRDMGAELERTECSGQYRKEAEVVREMRSDYFLVKAQIKTLPWQDYRILDSHLSGFHDLVKLAGETDCTYDGVKNRLKRARNRIYKSTTFCLERKHENN